MGPWGFPNSWMVKGKSSYKWMMTRGTKLKSHDAINPKNFQLQHLKILLVCLRWHAPSSPGGDETRQLFFRVGHLSETPKAIKSMEIRFTR